MNLDKISEYSEVAAGSIPWLKPLEKRIQAARSSGHWCLWLDKYAFAWAKRCDAAAERWQTLAKAEQNKERKRELRSKADAIPSGKTAALMVAAALANDGRLAEIQRRCAAWLETLKSQLGDRFGCVELVAESRLLLHLGRANVLENVGLYCDHTTGLPLIPGTALKGIVSAWACWAEHFNPAGHGSFRGFTESSRQRRNFTAEEARLACRILGDNSATGSESAGEVIFVGGFPLTPPKLGLDIVNPHYDEETDRHTRQIRVCDKTRLTPNTFLCLEPGTIWRFVFYVRAGVPDAADLLKQTSTWIEEALTQLGIGAKTAAGYGRFHPPNDNERSEIKRLDDELRDQIEKEQTLLTASPEDRPYLEFIASVKDWDEQIRRLAELGEAEKAHIRRFLASEEGANRVEQWRSTRGGRRQIKRLEEAGLL